MGERSKEEEEGLVTETVSRCAKEFLGRHPDFEDRLQDVQTAFWAEVDRTQPLLRDDEPSITADVQRLLMMVIERVRGQSRRAMERDAKHVPLPAEGVHALQATGDPALVIDLV